MAPLSILPRLSGLGLLRHARLPLSTKASSNVPEAGVMEPVRQVFISQSTDVFSNLALEDWLYRHHDFEHKRLLLLWRNDPCVVIGRHQNPWTEADVPYVRSSYIDLARRYVFLSVENADTPLQLVKSQNHEMITRLNCETFSQLKISAIPK